MPPFGDDCREPPEAEDPLERFRDFAAHVRARLDAGRAAYGDTSFSADPAELVAELQQEALDLAGWGFVLWTRLEAMRRALAARAPAARVSHRPPPGRLVGASRGR